ncbi:serine/arginine-rich splicing factor SC35-like [Alnus glutinosa]|uniref:serine/arginine-rich splicing factor SC35-like n=1 Tax=Alnus glutinosa TaxID=3517 RepID=UPI002D768201|nr:serine/arginine-rich splicing factor SC35-like [Alnus glutinosa]
MMSHFGKSGPPNIRDTYSLLVLNITFRTTADDLFPLFDKYGKVIDVFIPRDQRRRVFPLLLEMRNQMLFEVRHFQRKCCITCCLK